MFITSSSFVPGYNVSFINEMDSGSNEVLIPKSLS